MGRCAYKVQAPPHTDSSTVCFREIFTGVDLLSAGAIFAKTLLYNSVSFTFSQFNRARRLVEGVFFLEYLILLYGSYISRRAFRPGRDFPHKGYSYKGNGEMCFILIT